MEKIFEIMETALALAGYKVMDGSADWIIIRNVQHDKDYELKIEKLVG